MDSKFRISKPFFEIGPKTYLFGAEAVKLAIAADEAAATYGVDIIFSASYTDIRPIKDATSRLHVFAQHMDSVYPGRGIGAVTAEALKDAGAEGVLLNHAERPLTLEELTRCIDRARQVGLVTLVCAGTPKEGAAVACLQPDIILAESPALIGKGSRGPEDMVEINRINQMIYRIDPDMLVLHGAGISNARDVFEIIKAGADATGSTSGILKADDPLDIMRRMIAAVAEAWQQRAAKDSSKAPGVTERK